MLPASSGPLPHACWRAGNSAQITPTTVGGVLRTAASRVPGRTALVFGERRWSYADLFAEARDTARALLASFDPGDVVAVWAGSCPERVTLEFAAGLSGLILALLHPSAGAEEVMHALAHSGAKGIFLGTDGGGSSRISLLRRVECLLPSLKVVISLSEWDAVRAIGSLDFPGSVTSLPEVDPDSPAQILYTSGTTGWPKAALVTHRALTNSARLAAAAFGGRDGDVVVDPMPLSGVAGCGLMTLGIAQIGGTHVLMPRPDPELQLSLIDKHRGTLLCGLPTTLAAMSGHGSFGTWDLRSVRAVVSGGTRIPPGLAADIERALGVPVLTAFVQAECGVITATTPEDTLADRLGGVGRPLPGTDVRVADIRTGATAGCGTIGEICVRGYQVTRGYLDDPVATAAAIDSDGWLRTGDLGSMDDRGYLRVVGRLRELIVRGGQHVYPCEVEAVLLGHPDVAEAAVVGVPDRLWGETVAAVVRLRSPLEAATAALSEYCSTRLDACEVPVRWLFAEQFPRTANGKIRKDAIAARLADTSALPWTSEMARALAADLTDHHDDPPDLAGPLAELLGLRVPRQER